MGDEYLLLSFAIPSKEMEKSFRLDENPMKQTHNFNWKLIRALESITDFKFTYISSRPISRYPINSQKIVRKNDFSIKVDNNEILIHELGYLNISVFQLITRFRGAYYNMKNKLKNNNVKGIIIYSIHLPYMIAGYILSKKYNVELIGVWTDPPYMNIGINNENILRRLEDKILKYIMNKYDKVISLTEKLAIDFTHDVNYLVVEGIVEQELKEKKYLSDGKLIYTYTGIISIKYGLDNIVNAFVRLKDIDIELHLYGWGDYVDDIELISKNYPHIKYMGIADSEEVKYIQQNSDFLINARSANDEYVQYSFPSKMMEYMASGTPIISTYLSGMPKEYKQYFILLQNNKAKTIEKKIIETTLLSANKRKNIGLKAQKFIYNKNYKKQGERIKSFLEGDR